jgi:hypothetical protein
VNRLLVAGFCNVFSSVSPLCSIAIADSMRTSTIEGEICYADTPIRRNGSPCADTFPHSPSKQVTLISSRLSAETQWTQVASLVLVSKLMKFGSGGRVVVGGVWRQLKHHDGPIRSEKAFLVPSV